MLIRLSLKNWMSFRDEVVFSMIASKERRHGERVPKLEKYHARVLPVAAIYGGNASGKTNIFNALRFARYFVVRGFHMDERISVVPFALNDRPEKEATSFCFEILADECIYEFSFSVDEECVREEKLVKVVSATSEKTLYHRKGGEMLECPVCEKEPRLKSVFEGTRKNQLLLTNSVFQKLDCFIPVYNWFRYSLVIVGPDSHFGGFEHFIDKKSPLYEKMNDLLRMLDTGIDHVGGDSIPFENVPISHARKEDIDRDLKEGESLRISVDDERRFVLTRKDGKISAKQVVFFHRTEEGKDVKFGMEYESDGSKRALDLLPAFLDLSHKNSKSVYVIDELDRSLHTSLSRSLIEMYLSESSEVNRSQLLMTTHDVLLMDQELFRRDEMWLTERSREGVSSLTSICEFKDVRYDKDLRKSYLQGRFGGIPKILLGGYSHCASDEEGSR